MNRFEQIKKSWELKIPSRPIVESDIDWLIEQAEKAERYEKALKECIEQDGLMKFLDDNDWAISEDYFVRLAKDALYK